MSERVAGKEDVSFYLKEKPGMGRGTKGQLLLTSRRVVLIKFVGGKFTTKSVDYGGQIDEGLRNEGSLEIPLGKITEAAADRMMGTPYFRLRYRTPGGEEACSFILTKVAQGMAAGGLIGLALATRKSPYEKTAEMIAQLKAAQAAPSQVPAVRPAEAAAPAQKERPKKCPSCGADVGPTFLFCVACGGDL